MLWTEPNNGWIIVQNIFTSSAIDILSGVRFTIVYDSYMNVEEDNMMKVAKA